VYYENLLPVHRQRATTRSPGRDRSNPDAVRLARDTLRRVEHGLNEAIDAAKSSGIGQAEVVEMLRVLCEEEGR
jgi:hypothetical protein